jgi:type II secretory pathway predicted ATPase ExeA
MTEVHFLPTSMPDGKRSGLWQTTNATGIDAMIERTRAMGDICLITGPSGVGKTTAAITAARNQRYDADRETIYVSMTRATEGLQAGIIRIAAAAGRAIGSHVGAQDAFQELVHRRWLSGSVLIIDEAQFMSDALLDGVRNLWDELDHKAQAIGIVLIGTSELADRIKGSNRHRSRAFDPLRGRIGACITLEPSTSADVAAICRFYGLVGPATEKLIHTVARGPGGLHNVRRLIAQAERLAGDKQKLGLSDLKRAAELAGVAS